MKFAAFASRPRNSAADRDIVVARCRGQHAARRGDLEEEVQRRSSARRGPRRAGRAPVAGPWAANAAAPADERVSTWAVAAWSGLEAAGLAMIIGGAIGHDVTVNVPSATPAKVSVVPLVAPQAGMLSLRTSW